MSSGEEEKSILYIHKMAGITLIVLFVFENFFFLSRVLVIFFLTLIIDDRGCIFFQKSWCIEEDLGFRMRRMVFGFSDKRRGEKIFLRCILVFVLKQPYQFIIYTFFRMALETFFIGSTFKESEEAALLFKQNKQRNSKKSFFRSFR